MNCPSRTDDTLDHPDWNQNPSRLSPDITTRNDLNGITNFREQRNHTSGLGDVASTDISVSQLSLPRQDDEYVKSEKGPAGGVAAVSGNEVPESDSGPPRRPFTISCFNNPVFLRICWTISKFVRFLGPGFLIAVAYIDPGNYSTDVGAGAEFKYRLLFVVLLSNLFAIFLQSLCIKLGSVTGLNLAENCRQHLPRWMVYILYAFSEASIIATDISEVSKQKYSLKQNC